MTFTKTSELPATIRDVLPEEAQELYMSAYNEALEMQLPEGNLTVPRESLAHQLAWEAVRREFVQDARTHQWHRSGEEPVPSEEEPKGLFRRLKKMLKPENV